MQATLSTPISFRLSNSEHGELLSRAAALQVSPAQYARDLVREALRGTSRNHTEAADWAAELAGLRRDLENVVLVLLRNAGKLSADQANHWVDTQLRRR